MIVDNLLVFRDNSHITVPYAAYLAPLVNDEVNLIFPPPRPPNMGGSGPRPSRPMTRALHHERPVPSQGSPGHKVRGHPAGSAAP